MSGKNRNIKSIKLRFLFIFILFACLLCPLSAAGNKEKEVPAYFPFTFGKFQITVIYDGNIAVPKANLVNVSEADREALLSKAFIGGDIPSSVNAFLINTGSQLILVDTGAGHTLESYGPMLGYLPRNLKNAGYSPGQIDIILITHCHRDHLGGLLDKKDKPVFPNATVYVPRLGADFWSNQENASQYPERFLPYFELVQRTANILSARGKWKTYEHGENPLAEMPELHVIGIPGHTPGHSAFEITSEGKKFIIWGDITHVAALQLPDPSIGISYDLDSEEAAASRFRLLNYLTSERFLVGGMHLPFPGIGHVREESEGSYSWIPVEYAYKIESKQNSYY